MLKNVLALILTIIIVLQVIYLKSKLQTEKVLIAFIPAYFSPYINKEDLENLKLNSNINVYKTILEEINNLLKRNIVENKKFMDNLTNIRIRDEEALIKEMLEEEKDNLEKTLYKDIKESSSNIEAFESFFNKFTDERLKFVNLNLKLSLLHIDTNQSKEYETELNNIINKKKEFENEQISKRKAQISESSEAQKQIALKSYNEFEEKWKAILKKREKDLNNQIMLQSKSLLKDIEDELEKQSKISSNLKKLIYIHSEEFDKVRNKSPLKIKFKRQFVDPDDFIDILQTKRKMIIIDSPLYVKESIGINLYNRSSGAKTSSIKKR